MSVQLKRGFKELSNSKISHMKENFKEYRKVMLEVDKKGSVEIWPSTWEYAKKSLICHNLVDAGLLKSPEVVGVTQIFKPTKDGATIGFLLKNEEYVSNNIK